MVGQLVARFGLLVPASSQQMLPADSSDESQSLAAANLALC